MSSFLLVNGTAQRPLISLSSTCGTTTEASAAGARARVRACVFMCTHVAACASLSSALRDTKYGLSSMRYDL
eukprot:6194567-Pleurochrysis_carterae.AAC.1